MIASTKKNIQVGSVTGKYADNEGNCIGFSIVL